MIFRRPLLVHRLYLLAMTVYRVGVGMYFRVRPKYFSKTRFNKFLASTNIILLGFAFTSGRHTSQCENDFVTYLFFPYLRSDAGTHCVYPTSPSARLCISNVASFCLYSLDRSVFKEITKRESTREFIILFVQFDVFRSLSRVRSAVTGFVYVCLHCVPCSPA